MTLHFYKCNVCNHEYQEGRAEGESQWFTNCVVTGCSGIFEEVTND
jgi:hypothetical protein